MRLYDITRCDGAKQTEPEAKLCRTCAHAQPAADGPFIEAAVRIERSVLGVRFSCPNYIPAERAD